MHRAISLSMSGKIVGWLAFPVQFVQLSIQRAEVIDDTDQQATTRDEVKQAGHPFALVEAVNTEEAEEGQQNPGGGVLIRTWVKRASALRSMPGMRKRSTIQPMRNRPPVQNQRIPVAGLPK